MAAQARIFYLVGFMGSGKTSVGQELASALNAPFYDLDLEIETATQTKVSDLFAREGEPAFRRIEFKSLQSVIQRAQKHECAVIALGGGTFVSDHCRDKIQSTGVSLYLKTRLDTLIQRLKKAAEFTKRPLLWRDGRFDLDQLRSLYQSRISIYQKAHHSFQTDEKSIPILVKEIRKAIQSELQENTL